MSRFTDLLEVNSGYQIKDRGDAYKTKEYYKDGKLHRDDGPAIENEHGREEYYKHGLRHREDGPAYVDEDGNAEWYQNDQLHRDDGPAIIDEFGDEFWYLNGVEMSQEEWEMRRYNKSIPKYQIRYRKDGAKVYYKKGQIHRDDGPAIEHTDGTKEYYKDGKLHRAEGPAIEHTDGTKEYYKDGKRHRDDGPAYEGADGTKIWYKNGKGHRDNGPAVERANGTKEWWKNDQHHRDDGPATEHADGTKEWWLNHKKISKEEWERRRQKNESLRLVNLLEADPKPTKTREKERVESPWDADVDFEPSDIVRPEKKTRVSREEAEEELQDVVRDAGFTLDDFSGADVERLLDQIQTDPDFDFDAVFDELILLARKKKIKPKVKSDVGVPTTTQTRFQTTQPDIWRPGAVSTHVREPRYVRDAKAEILKVLMDEFVGPAMSLGQNILPAVWQELGRLHRSDPKIFKEQFGSALNSIREVENSWFANILGVHHIPVRVSPPEGEDKKMHDRITHVLKRYYDAVLKEAGRNANYLKQELEIIKDSVGEEKFEKAFFEALSDTRDVEDRAFSSMLGGPLRLTMREYVGRAPDARVGGGYGSAESDASSKFSQMSRYPKNYPYFDPVIVDEEKEDDEEEDWDSMVRRAVLDRKLGRYHVPGTPWNLRIGDKDSFSGGSTRFDLGVMERLKRRF